MSVRVGPAEEASVEFREVVRRRRMVRRYREEPVDDEVLERILAHGIRAPSAGYSQGYAFLVLTRPEDRARFWSLRGEDDSAPWAGEGTLAAPIVIVPLSNEDAYLDRYAEADKGWTDRSEEHWPVPYWHIDTGFASLLMLLTAVDEGLGALFFGVPGPLFTPLREAFGVPEEYTPIGAITVGHRQPSDQEPPSSATTRPQIPLDEVVHRGRW